MYSLIHLTTIALTHNSSTSRLPLRRVLLLTALATTLACFALSPTARGADGGLPNENTAEGDGALQSLASNGVRNTAIGFDALFSNTGGGANTAIGASALANNTANDNTACGSFALANNTADGHLALFSNTTGNDNTANGVAALQSNTTGINNTATGFQALFSNTTG